MEKNFTTLSFLLFFIANSMAQQFTGTGGIITNDGMPTYFLLPVSGLPSQLNSSFGLETVCINITHPDITELYVYLISPSGIKVELTDGKSCEGSDYSGTCFNSSLSNSITLGSSPYSGSYKPIGYLGRFNNGQNPNGTWKLYVKDWLYNANSGSLVDWSITFSTASSPAVNFTSSNLPIIIINTSNREITEGDLTATMGIIDNGTNRNYLTDNWNGYNGYINIHVRGHSSTAFEKESFSVETRDAAGNNFDVGLLGMAPENDWVLGAEYVDKTLMRNRLTYYLARSMGDYAARCRSVEVVINGEYYGVYTFMEKPKRADFRINIAKLEPTENTYPSITGGYILKIDRADAPGWYSLFAGNATTTHFYYQYVYPKDTAITAPQQNYIHSVTDSFETAMASPNFADTETGYPHFIEPNSFVDFFILNELGKNVDAYRASTYITKDRISRGGKIKAGPVWDFDISWHNANYGDAFLTWNWECDQNDNQLPYPTWWAKLRTDGSFNNRLQCRWNTFRQNVLSNAAINSYIDATVAELTEAQQRNFTQWPVLGAYIQPNPQDQNGATWASEVQDLKNWVSARASWMDSQLPAPTECDTVTTTPENPDTSTTPAVILLPPHPNPFVGTFKITYEVDANAVVRIEMIGMLGEVLALLYSDTKTAGIYTQDVTVPPLATGLYMMKLSVGSHVFKQKMMKLSD
jgi:subtilisin-like proprotein convertase family protein